MQSGTLTVACVEFLGSAHRPQAGICYRMSPLCTATLDNVPGSSFSFVAGAPNPLDSLVYGDSSDAPVAAGSAR